MACRSAARSALVGHGRDLVTRAKRLSARRTYYSYEHEQPAPFEGAQAAILSSALSQVPAHGFTAKSLSLGAQEAGYLPASTNLFPRGPSIWSTTTS